MIVLGTGFGDTPTPGLYGMVYAAPKVMHGTDVTPVRHLTGSCVTALELANCSITVTAVDARPACWRAD